MKRTFLPIVGMIGLGALLSGCPKSVKVTRFDVEPKHACSGADVIVRWETEGAESVELSSEPETDPRLGSVGTSGSERREIDETTEITITASNGSKTDAKSETVEIVPPGGEDFHLGTWGQCVDGRARWLVVAGSEWDERLRVRTVWNESTREIQVTHEGRTQAFPPIGGSSAIFAGTSLRGDWVIVPRILELSEICPAPGTVVDVVDSPRLGGLTIGVNASCE